MIGVNRAKSSNTSSNSSNGCGCNISNGSSVYVHFTYTDANNTKQEFDTDIFASVQLAEAARDGIKSILKATGAKNIRACIKSQG